MQVFFLLSLFILWLLFWSFASVIIYRLQSWEKWVFLWRSHCQSCNKLLSFLDLIPLFSYIFHKWKCAYCKKTISYIYPLLEVSMGLIFMLIGKYLIDFPLLIMGDKITLIKLGFLLIIAFITIIFVFYDILFLEIPESILFIGIFITFIFLAFNTLFLDLHFYDYSFVIWINSLSYTSLFLSFFILVWFYVIMLGEMKEIYDILLLLTLGAIIFTFKRYFYDDILSIPLFSWIIASLLVFTFFFLQIVVSGGKWMGGGDLRIAVFMGLILWMEKIIYGILATYILGSFVGIGIVIFQKIKYPHKKVNTMIPFWPFLGLATFLTLFYTPEIQKIFSFYL